MSQRTQKSWGCIRFRPSSYLTSRGAAGADPGEGSMGRRWGMAGMVVWVLREGAIVRGGRQLLVAQCLMPLLRCGAGGSQFVFTAPMITLCPHCGTQVLILANGVCPACRKEVRPPQEPVQKPRDEARTARVQGKRVAELEDGPITDTC